MLYAEDSPDGLARVKSGGLPEVKQLPADELEAHVPPDATVFADAKGEGKWPSGLLLALLC